MCQIGVEWGLGVEDVMGEQAEKFCSGSGGSIRLDARCPQVIRKVAGVVDDDAGRYKYNGVDVEVVFFPCRSCTRSIVPHSGKHIGRVITVVVVGR